MLCFGAIPRIDPMPVDQNGAETTPVSQPRSKSVSSVRVTDKFFGNFGLTTCTSIDTVDG